MKRRKLVWSDRAEADLAGIGEFISRDDPVAARRWVAELISTAKVAAKMPFAGRRVPEFQREEVREVFLKRHRIVYRVEARRCVVLSVFEGHKLLDL